MSFDNSNSENYFSNIYNCLIDKICDEEYNYYMEIKVNAAYVWRFI